MLGPLRIIKTLIRKNVIYVNPSEPLILVATAIFRDTLLPAAKRKICASVFQCNLHLYFIFTDMWDHHLETLFLTGPRLAQGPILISKFYIDSKKVSLMWQHMILEAIFMKASS